MTTTIRFTITLEQPLHHGAGTAGNTSLLRTEEVIQPDGSIAQVPFVSGNSVRHGLREALAWHLVDVLDVEPGSLPKPVVDLLWSGGAVTETGAQTDLDTSRLVEELLPSLNLLGYSARADIHAGTLRVSPLHLVCKENAWRQPAHADHPHAQRRAAAFRGEEFGTRHDVTGTAVDRYIALADKTLGGGVQMIYDVQTLLPGSVLAGDFSLTPAATPEHTAVLSAALHLWAPDSETHLGAKNSIGYGRGHVASRDWPSHDSGSLLWWTEHLEGHRDEILALLGKVTGT